MSTEWRAAVGAPPLMHSPPHPPRSTGEKKDGRVLDLLGPPRQAERARRLKDGAPVLALSPKAHAASSPGKQAAFTARPSSGDDKDDGQGEKRRGAGGKGPKFRPKTSAGAVEVSKSKLLAHALDMQEWGGNGKDCANDADANQMLSPPPLLLPGELSRNDEARASDGASSSPLRDGVGSKGASVPVQSLSPASSPLPAYRRRERAQRGVRGVVDTGSTGTERTSADSVDNAAWFSK